MKSYRNTALQSVTFVNDEGKRHTVSEEYLHQMRMQQGYHM